MKYDDASWHYGGEFPSDLPPEAGATHTGMFVVWAFLSGLVSELHKVDFPDSVPCLQSRRQTPGAFFLGVCEGKFVADDLNVEGNAFTADYFDLEHGQYLADYEATLAVGLPEAYYVPDTWENFDKLKPVLDTRFIEWKAKHG